MPAEIRREVFERGHGVCVLPYDPAGDRLVLIEQFRVAPYVCGDRAWLVEVIAGVIDAGEAPEDVARREAKEEAGLTLDRPLERIGRFYSSPGAMSETLTLFCAPGPCPPTSAACTAWPRKARTFASSPWASRKRWRCWPMVASWPRRRRSPCNGWR